MASQRARRSRPLALNRKEPNEADVGPRRIPRIRAPWVTAGGARRELAPQPELRLVAADADWTPDDDRDPLAGLAPADPLTKKRDRIV
jgi:hypothetical protein